MDRMLSVETMMKGEMPRPRQGRMVSFSSFILAVFSFRMDFLPVRNRRIHRADTIWLITVAMAAPATPRSRAKIRMGSRAMLITAPMTVVSMEMLAKPWVVMKVFIPMTISTEMLPRM